MSYWVSLHNPGTAELATVEIFKEGGIYDLLGSLQMPIGMLSENPTQENIDAIMDRLIYASCDIETDRIVELHPMLKLLKVGVTLNISEIKKIRLKRKLKSIYLRYLNACPDYDCGFAIRDYINAGACRLKVQFNTTLRQLKNIDPDAKELKELT